MLVGGKRVRSASGEVIPIRSPANRSTFAHVPRAGAEDVDRALRTALRVEAGWVQVGQGTGQVPGQSGGGVKQSGSGREFPLEGMLDGFTLKKSVTVNLGLAPP